MPTHSFCQPPNPSSENSSSKQVGESEHNIKILLKAKIERETESSDTTVRYNEQGIREKFRKPSAGRVLKIHPRKGVCPRCEPGEVFVIFPARLLYKQR